MPCYEIRMDICSECQNDVLAPLYLELKKNFSDLFADPSILTNYCYKPGSSSERQVEFVSQLSAIAEKHKMMCFAWDYDDSGISLCRDCVEKVLMNIDLEGMRICDERRRTNS